MTTQAVSSTEQLRLERHAVETFYRAFSEQNPDLVDAVLAPHWEDIPLGPDQVPGPEGVKAIIRTFAQGFPDVKITVHDLMQLPGKIAVRAEITGTHLGEFFGIAATGRAVSFRLQEMHALEGGRVVTTWHMEDLFGLFMQLGQFPPAG